MKYIKAFFFTLGVIFFLLLIGLAYLIIVDPYNVKPLLTALQSRPQVEQSDTRDAPASSDGEVSGSGTATPTAEGTVLDAPVPLTPAQAAALEVVGIDPASLPSSISPEQEACFIEKIGADRVEAIKAGAAPTPVEMWQARECL